MFWADRAAEELKKRKLPLEWVDDMKTPSGKIHVGALRGVVIHDLVYKSLLSKGVKTKYTYVFDNHDPMDALPLYLSKEKFEKYLGMPLYKIPSPVSGFKSYAKYYAQEFIDVFRAIGCSPEILWATDLYLSGKMNDVIKLCLDKKDVIRDIYGDLYKKELPKDWYPFQVFCPNCGKVSTTKVTGWDGEKVSFTCDIDRVKWTKGCGSKGSVSPFSNKKEIAGKLPWKVEWACKWKVIGVTVEGAGKDHMSRGGSHDLASLVCKRVIDYPVPYPIAYEWFMVGGKKMSTSKGVGSPANEMLEILPPELLRFLMVKTKINQAINFDPSGDTIPKLFDEYQIAALDHKSGRDMDMARIFELSQVGKLKYPPRLRFQHLTQWVQMLNMTEEIKKEGLEGWTQYAKIWVEKFAPDHMKFSIQKGVPEQARNLTTIHKKYLLKVASELNKKWNPDEFQKELYNWAQEVGISSNEAFRALYISLLGKDYGPKAAWLILNEGRDFVKKRFSEIANVKYSGKERSESRGNVIPDLIGNLDSRFRGNDKLVSSRPASPQGGQARTIKPEIFSIDQKLKESFPSISIGIAVIKGVKIQKTNKDLEKEKEALLKSLEDLTTEQLGQYPEIKSYRKLYKETGIDWHSRRSSPEALLRRISLKRSLYNVNTCIDACNLVAMKHRVSIGAFDLDRIEFPTTLKFAKKGEEILLLDNHEPTKYKEGEIAYFDNKGGYNIDFNYRDAQRTAVQLTTKNLYINVDGIYEITPCQTENVLKEICDKIVNYCGGRIELFGLEVIPQI